MQTKDIFHRAAARLELDLDLDQTLTKPHCREIIPMPCSIKNLQVNTSFWPFSS
jgi:hypothetical protein